VTPTADPRSTLRVVLSGGGEPLLVPTEDLKALLDVFFVKFEADRNPNHSRTKEPTHSWPLVAVEGPTGWLSRESGVPQRRIWGIRNGESAYVTLDTADKLLQGMDVPFAFHDGSVRVVTNPRLKMSTILATLRERGCPDLLVLVTA
jgi:hypothetical protein